MTPPPRLHLLVARDAPKILIIRRSPSKVFHLIAWNTETDEFEHGSWFRGRLYEYRCDLSCDGQWLVYFALGPTPQIWSWTAICRPPWVRAETLWPQTDTWFGGGVWLSSQRLLLDVPPGVQHRETDTSPHDLGIKVEILAPQVNNNLFFSRLAHESWQKAVKSTDVYAVNNLFFLRLARDGWRQTEASSHQVERTEADKSFDNTPDWFLQPSSNHPVLRMCFRRRYQGYEYVLDRYPELLDTTTNWAGWDQFGRLVVARAGAIERYTLDDLTQGTPSFRYDLNDLTPPPRSPRSSTSSTSGEYPDTALSLGPDEQGRYHYLGKLTKRDSTRIHSGHPIRTQADLQAIAPILREDRDWSFEKPQTYVVTVDGVFVLGGRLNKQVDITNGEAVLAAGEAMLEEQPDGTWHITAINNRSYEYMPAASSWGAVEAALSTTGIPYPRDGFTEVYPLEGTWEDILSVLRE